MEIRVISLTDHIILISQIFRCKSHEIKIKVTIRHSLASLYTPFFTHYTRMTTAYRQTERILLTKSLA